MVTKQRSEVVSDKQKPNLISFFILTSIALPLIMFGAFALEDPQAMPWVVSPSLAWSAIVVGVVIDAAAIAAFFQELKRVKRLR